MPLGLVGGRPIRPLRRAISSRCAATVRSRSATLPGNSITSAVSVAGDNASGAAARAIAQGNQSPELPGREIRAAARLAPLTIYRAKLLASGLDDQDQRARSEPARSSAADTGERSHAGNIETRNFARAIKERCWAGGNSA